MQYLLGVKVINLALDEVIILYNDLGLTPKSEVMSLRALKHTLASSLKVPALVVLLTKG